MRQGKDSFPLSVLPGLKRGFTLIELMLVVAIIGLLAAIAIPKFADLVIKAKEASVKGKMGSLRSAISIYYANNEGRYPATYTLLQQCLTTGGFYLDSFPTIGVPTQPTKHPQAANGYLGNLVVNSVYDGSNAFDLWSYTDFPVATGEIRVNCTHTDSKGTTWSLY